MKEFLPIIKESRLFCGLSERDLTSVLACLNAKKTSFPKGAFILRAGETTESIGLVLSGSILIIQEDV